MATLKTANRMSLAHFHDFYFLEALKAGISRETMARPELQFSRSVEKLQYDVETVSENIQANMALRVFTYLYAACFGEARHAQEVQAQVKFIKETHRLGRSDCYREIVRFAPSRKNVQTLVDVFNQDWSSAFGGKAWMNIAQALKLYFDATPAAFLDYVIDLEHNGGCVFNKEDAFNTVQFSTSYPFELKAFLDWKFSHDILSRPPQFAKSLPLTRKVFSLVERFTVIFRRGPVEWVEPGLNRLSDYIVEWGNEEFTLDEKWCEGVDVLKDGNTPNPDTLFGLTNLYECPVGAMTEKELTAHVKKIRKAVLKKVRRGSTKELRKSFDKKVNDWLQSNITGCKPTKNKITYPVLPCKFRTKPGMIEIQIPVEYTGVGNQTDYGFKMSIAKYAPSHQPDTVGYDGEPGYVDAHIATQYGITYIMVRNSKIILDNKKLEAYLD